jgi:quercetin dioxygenase-like cupin family protein
MVSRRVQRALRGSTKRAELRRNENEIVWGRTDMRLGSLVVGVMMLSAGAALADGYPAIPLFSGNKTVMDETIAYPTQGQAMVNALVVVLGPGEKTVLHKHGVPTFIHVLEGEVTVDYEGRGTRTYRQGESFLEAMDVTHAGINTGTVPVKILAVYMGADGAKDVIKQP